MKHIVLVVVMTLALFVFEPEAYGEHRARPVTGSQVMPLLYKLGAQPHLMPDFGEISEAIATASTEDPLFPSFEEGSEMTAAILVAIAHYESGFSRSAVGDNGRSFGLFQIQPPTARVDQKLLTVPKTASFIAIDIIRRSFKHCMAHGKHWSEGLAWYAASSDEGSKSPAAVRASKTRMRLAAELFETFFSKGRGMEGLLVRKS